MIRSSLLLTVLKSQILKTSYRSTRRAVFNLTVHIVLVTKYRRKVIDAQMKQELEQVFKSVLASWDSELIEFNCESDHAHLIVSYPPHKLLSSLIANLKATSSKTMWRKFELVVSKTYHKRVFWTGAYFVASCGGVTIEVLRKYVQDQDSPSLDPAQNSSRR
jgi:putative transposase